jgi:hypothetical protein
MWKERKEERRKQERVGKRRRGIRNKEKGKERNITVS